MINKRTPVSFMINKSISAQIGDEVISLFLGRLSALGFWNPYGTEFGRLRLRNTSTNDK